MLEEHLTIVLIKSAISKCRDFADVGLSKEPGIARKKKIHASKEWTSCVQ